MMNSVSKKNRTQLVGETNPFKSILDDIKPEDRIGLLMIRDTIYEDKSVMYVACEYNDFETIMCMVSSVTDQTHRIHLLLGSPEHMKGETVLHTAASHANADVVSYLLHSLPANYILYVMSRKDEAGLTPLLRSMHSKNVERIDCQDDVTSTFLSFLIEIEKGHEYSKYFHN